MPVGKRSAIDDVQSALLDIERGFSDGFAQGRMGMTGAADVFGAPIAK